jgi:hypothetical protein
MTMAGRDLFNALRVVSATAHGTDRALHASRVDIGWAAWRASTSPLETSRLKRWSFYLKLWQHFGHAQFLVQIDDSYHTATSIRIRHQPEQGNMDILLIQTASSWQCLLGLVQKQLGKTTPPWRKQLSGQVMLISRYPSSQDQPVLPDVHQLGYSACAEVLLDGQHSGQLPLRISSTR